MIVGAMYVLDLTCDAPDCEAADHYSGNARGDTTRLAREAGWTVTGPAP
jgi:hypothetical protein